MTNQRTSQQPPTIWLEPLEAQHADKLFAGLSDDELYKFVADSPPESIEGLRARYAELAKRRPQKGASGGRETWLNWAVLASEERDYAGYVQATIGADGIAEVGYVLARAFWGRGVGQAAVTAMLELLRAEHGVSEFLARVDTRHAKSKRLLKQLGFRCVGTHTEAEWINGRLCDDAIYKLLDA